MFKRFLFMVLLILFSSNTFAEEKKGTESEKKEKDLTKLEEIVVTATRTEKGLESAPGSVNVVTKKDIANRDVQTVDEALNTTAGVVDRRGKSMMDKMTSITLRGVPGQQRTLVLKDGIAINNSSSGSVDWNSVAPEDVERIEVVKGPFSSLYGGNAMGGVINIITKMPDKREFTVKGGYGSSWNRGKAPDDLQTYYVSYGDKIEDKLRLFLSYGYKGTNGYPSDLNVQSTQPTAGITGWSPTTSNTGAQRYLIGDKGDNAWRNDNINFKAGYDISSTSSVKFSYLRATDNYHYDAPNTYLRNAAGNEVWSYGTVKEASFLAGAGGTELNLYNVELNTQLSQTKIKMSLGYLDQAASWYVTPNSSAATRAGGAGTVNDTPTSAYNADLQLTVPLLDRHILTFGGTFKTGSADNQTKSLANWGDEGNTTALTYQAKGRDRTYSVFLQDEILLYDKLTAYIGFREDWWETYDGYVNTVGAAGYPKTYDNRSASSFSPKGALVYKPFEQTTLRTSAGQAFRSPTLNELYQTFIIAGKTYASNPDLKPETVTSWDISAEQGLWKGAKIKATYFENYISDLIYSKTTTPTLFDKVNAGKAESRGVELEAEQRFDKWLRLFANFTYTDSSIKENNASPASVGKDMTLTPRVMVNAGCDLQKGPLSASITGRYVGKQYGNDDNSDKVSNVYGSYDDFFTADAKISYKPVSWVEASFSVSNILDREYYSYYLSPGRSWFLSLALKY